MAEIAPRPEPSPEDITASYGFVGLLGDAVPEIRALLHQAIANKWTPDRFVMSVASTNWWKSTPAVQREWVVRTATDPAQAATEMAAGAGAITHMAAQLGVPKLSVEQARKIWLETKIAGYDENNTRAYVAQRAFEMGKPEADGSMGGRMGQLAQEMFQLAHDYGYTSPRVGYEIMDNVKEIMSHGGSIDTTQWRDRMIRYASAYYAPYAEDIKGGKTLAEVSQPIVSRVAQLLEANPDALSVNDPIIKKALTEWNSEKGVNRAYTLREIEDVTRKDGRWLKTDNAMEESAKLLAEIGQRFGMTGGGS